MTIVDNRNNSAVLFRQIVKGECFECGSGFYMRVDYAQNAAFGNGINAISLNDGEEVFFESDEYVRPVKSHIVINNPDSPNEKGSYRDNY